MAGACKIALWQKNESDVATASQTVTENRRAAFSFGVESSQSTTSALATRDSLSATQETSVC